MLSLIARSFLSLLCFCSSRNRTFAHVPLAIGLSFGFYIPVVLFSGIDTLYLSGEEQTDAIALSHGISASEYFVNLISSQERSYYLVYDNEQPGEGVLSIAVSGLAVPEPTSSMLGLMGLVAFTLRRRRK